MNREEIKKATNVIMVLLLLGALFGYIALQYVLMGAVVYLIVHFFI